MAEIRRYYRLDGLNIQNLQNIFDQISQRLDEIEGYRGTESGIIATVFPVGAYYVNTTGIDPASYLGGSWVACGSWDAWNAAGTSSIPVYMWRRTT